MKVVVTGANGFIGTPLCDLLRARGHSVKALVRGNAQKDQIAVGDISTVNNWAELLGDQEAVIHLAALVHQQKPSTSASYDKVNTKAVETLMQAASQAGAQRLIFLSTAAVYGGNSPSAYLETDETLPETDYGCSKLKAERLISEFCQSGQLTSTVLRPPMVYGPNAKGNFKALVKLVDSGMPLPLASIANRRSFIYVENLADIIETCLHQPVLKNEIFNVSDLHDLSTTQLIGMIAKYLGRKEKLFYLPTGLLRVLATALGRRATVGKLLDSFRLDCTRLTTRLNWTPPFSVEQAIERSLTHYRNRL